MLKVARGHNAKGGTMLGWWINALGGGTVLLVTMLLVAMLLVAMHLAAMLLVAVLS
jgi:hypothetical protein